jgi:hypothetical protein
MIAHDVATLVPQKRAAERTVEVSKAGQAVFSVRLIDGAAGTCNARQQQAKFGNPRPAGCSGGQ